MALRTPGASPGLGEQAFRAGRVSPAVFWCRSGSHTIPNCLRISMTPGCRPGSVRLVGVSPRVPAHHAYQMYAHLTWHTYQRVGCVNQAAADDVRLAAA